MEIDKFVSKYSQDLFEEAVLTLATRNILFEGDYPFLNDYQMRGGRNQIILDCLNYFGFEGELNCLVFEVENQGWMHCIVHIGPIFKTILNINQKVQSHFTNAFTVGGYIE